MADLPLQSQLSIESTATISANVVTVKFGNGYEQRRPGGINAVAQVWQVEWRGVDETERDTIIDAIEGDVAGNFTWQPPQSASTLKFKIESYSLKFITSQLFSISATLTQVFDI